MAIMLALVLAATVMVCGCSGGDGGGSDAGSGADEAAVTARSYQLKKGTVAGSNLNADRVTEMRDEGADILLALGDDGSLTLNLYGVEQTGTWKLDDDSGTEGSASTDVTSYMLEMDGDDSVTLTSEDGSYDMQFEAIDADTYNASAEAMAALVVQPGCYRFVEGTSSESGEALDYSEQQAAGFNVYLRLGEDGTWQRDLFASASSTGTWSGGSAAEDAVLYQTTSDGSEYESYSISRDGDNIVCVSYDTDGEELFTSTYEPISQEDYDAALASMDALYDEAKQQLAGCYIISGFNDGTSTLTRDDLTARGLYFAFKFTTDGTDTCIDMGYSDDGTSFIATRYDEGAYSWQFQPGDTSHIFVIASSLHYIEVTDDGTLRESGDDYEITYERVDEDTYNSYCGF